MEVSIDDLKHRSKALLDEVNELLEKLYAEEELKVMSQPQMAEIVPTTTSGLLAEAGNISDIRKIMESIPDFDIQMQLNPEFKRTYENLVAFTNR